MSNEHTMCAYCNSINGGHTLACQAIHADSDKPKQVPIPPDAPYWKRIKLEPPEQS